MTTRAQVAAALSTVDGVIGYTFRPTTPKPGDGWPMLTGYSREDDGFLRRVLRVVILLPQNEVAASTWMDEKVPSIVDALRPVGYVTRIDPTEGPTAGQYSMTVTLESE